MKKLLRTSGLKVCLTFAFINSATSAPTPPLCIDSICIEDEVGKIENLDWTPSEPVIAGKEQWDEALAYWGTIFPEAKKSSLKRLQQNLVKRRIGREFIAFLENHPIVCRFEVFSGRIEDGDEMISVSVAPDSDYQWRVIRITKYYRNIANSDQISSYVETVRRKYTQWAEDDYWGDAEAPVNWDKNPTYGDYDFSFSLRHIVSYGSSQESANDNWASSFDYFVKHRKHLSKHGIDSVGSWSSEEYDKLYKSSEACTPEVTL